MAMKKCYRCNKRVFRSEDAIKDHNDSVHRKIAKMKNSCCCPICGTIFTNQAFMSDHIREAHGENGNPDEN